MSGFVWFCMCSFLKSKLRKNNVEERSYFKKLNKKGRRKVLFLGGLICCYYCRVNADLGWFLIQIVFVSLFVIFKLFFYLELIFLQKENSNVNFFFSFKYNQFDIIHIIINKIISKSILFVSGFF